MQKIEVREKLQKMEARGRRRSDWIHGDAKWQVRASGARRVAAFRREHGSGGCIFRVEHGKSTRKDGGSMGAGVAEGAQAILASWRHRGGESMAVR